MLIWNILFFTYLYAFEKTARLYFTEIIRINTKGMIMPIAVAIAISVSVFMR